MTGIRFEIDDFAFSSYLNEMVRTGQDLTEVMQEAGSYFEGSIKQRFEEGISPDGEPWIISWRAQYEGGKTLVDSAHLQNSFTSLAKSDEVLTGTNVIYAAIHNFGGVIEAKNAPKLAFKTPTGMAFLDAVTMPKRQFIGFNDNDQAAIEDIFMDYFEEVANGH
tara:strand:+ start:11002 stop:11493 length:492 start_codon:yes stop_codon:yes gene_type:complete